MVLSPFYSLLISAQWNVTVIKWFGQVPIDGRSSRGQCNDFIQSKIYLILRRDHRLIIFRSTLTINENKQYETEFQAQ